MKQCEAPSRKREREDKCGTGQPSSCVSKTNARNGRNHEIVDGSSVSPELLLARTGGSSCAVNLHFRQVLRWLHCIGDPKERLSGVIRIRGNCKSRGQYCVCCQGSGYINFPRHFARLAYTSIGNAFVISVKFCYRTSNHVYYLANYLILTCAMCLCTLCNKIKLTIVTGGIIFWIKNKKLINFKNFKLIKY